MKPTIYNGCADRDDTFRTLTVGGSSDEVFNLLVRNMKELGLTATEVILLEYLLSYVSEGDARVSPSLKEMHRATGFAPGTIHAAKRGLVGKGFIKILNERNKKRTNTYDLAPLREKIEGLTKQEPIAIPEPKADAGEATPIKVSGRPLGQARLPHASAASLPCKKIEKK
jgi:DNA-binding MarR family transcriptional regulator